MVSPDYCHLALWSCPTCSTLVPPAVPTREAESLDVEQTCSTLSSGDSISQKSVSFGPRFPSQMLSSSAPGPGLEGGRFLHFNCNGIQHCHTEHQDFLHPHQPFVVCVQDTKLCVYSSLKEFTYYATIMQDRQYGGRGGLVKLVS